jgi:hypothetical protein
MTRSEVITYLFSEELIEKFKNNFDLLRAYGVINKYDEFSCINENIWYTDILKYLKSVIDWLVTEASNDDVIRWTYLFNQIIGLKDKTKFIVALQELDIKMGWK